MKKLILIFLILFCEATQASFWGEKIAVDQGRFYGGGAAGTILGFGIGHGIQGRYSESGWIFTATELGSFALIMAGASTCVGDSLNENNKDCSLVSFGAAGFLVARVFEIIDLWAGAYPESSSPKVFLLPDPKAPGIGISHNF